MTQQTALATLENVSVKLGGIDILQNINLTIHQQEQWAIVGPSGSGKSTLAKALAGQVFHHGTITFHIPESTTHHPRVLLVEQQHRFKNRSNISSDFYYQQRYNSFDAEDSMTVAEALQEHLNENGFQKEQQHWIEQLHLTPLLQEPLIQLSNGENKRLQLAKALFTDPAVLILDNPFTGLDAEGRTTLHGIIDSIINSGIHVILIASRDELPAGITHIATLDQGRLTTAGAKTTYKPSTAVVLHHFPEDEKLNRLPPPAAGHFGTAVKMVNVTIRYGDKLIFSNMNWEVKKGERWAISGPNGSGKSTLLSLITADNPQAYANELYLFDRRRGSGESIWDIKQQIGFVSPELHLYFERTATCFDVIASGLFDTIGLFRRLSATQQQQVEQWIDLLYLQSVRNRSLAALSLGQQRVILLARALVKMPPLLVLDEPCQGLDEEQSLYIKSLIDQLCRHFDITLLYVSHYEKDIPDCVTHTLRL